MEQAASVLLSTPALFMFHVARREYTLDLVVSQKKIFYDFFLLKGTIFFSNCVSLFWKFNV